MEVTRELLKALSGAADRFRDAKIFVGEPYQYHTSFEAKSAIGSMGSNSEELTVYRPNRYWWPEKQVNIVIGKVHHSNYATEECKDVKGQTVQEFFLGNDYPSFLIVRRVGSSNWGNEGLVQWDTVTVMPCGFYRNQGPLIP